MMTPDEARARMAVRVTRRTRRPPGAPALTWTGLIRSAQELIRDGGYGYAGRLVRVTLLFSKPAAGFRAPG